MATFISWMLPQLSMYVFFLFKVADIRFHSRRVDKVMLVLNEAKLLDKSVDWQAIYCELASYRAILTKS